MSQEQVQQPEETSKEEEKETTQKDEVITQEPEVTEINKTGYVSTDGLRVRKGPSTDTEEITSLSKNDKVKVIGQSGKWYKIDLNGKTGYVSAKYISDTKIVETTSRSGSTLKNEEPPVVEEPKIEENKTEQFVHKTNFEFPIMSKDRLKIEKFPLGRHFYVFIDGVQIRQNENLKFNTYEEALSFAKKYLK